MVLIFEGCLASEKLLVAPRFCTTSNDLFDIVVVVVVICEEAGAMHLFNSGSLVGSSFSEGSVMFTLIRLLVSWPIFDRFVSFISGMTSNDGSVLVEGPLSLLLSDISILFVK